MKRQYVLLVILICIGVWAFSLTQGMQSIGQWLLGFSILAAVMITAVLLIYKMRTAHHNDREMAALQKAKESLDRERHDGKK